MWKKAIKIIPDGNTLLSKRPQLWLPRKWPTHFISSKNITLIDHKKKNIKIFYLPLEQMYWAIQIQKLIDKFQKLYQKGI